MITVSFIPVYIVLCAVWIGLYIRLPQHKKPRGISACAYILFGVYIGALIHVTFTPFVYMQGTAGPSMNLIPGVQTYLMIKLGVPSAAWYNVIGNFVMLMPCALLAPLIFVNMNTWWSITLRSCIISVCIEVCQLLFAIRIFDVDDIILNTLGASCAYALVSRLPLWRALVSKSQRGIVLTIPVIAGFSGFMGLIIGFLFAATWASA